VTPEIRYAKSGDSLKGFEEKWHLYKVREAG
jgi:hypothetical protein